MALYTIKTTREYEIALTYSYDHFKEGEETKEQHFQRHIDHSVLAVMNEQMKRSKQVNLTASIATVPEDNQAQLQADIEEDIIANGGTIVTGPPPGPFAV